MNYLYCFFVAALIFSTTLAAQESPSTEITYQERYDKLKELYYKHLDSESYIRNSELILAFADKVSFDGSEHERLRIRSSTVKNNELLEWIEKNIEKTQFKDFAEAKAEYDKLATASAAVIEENRAYFDYLSETIKLGQHQIFEDIVLEAMSYYPEKFKL